MWIEDSGIAVARTVYFLTGMGLILFVLAYLVRLKNRKLHMIFAVIATFLTLIAALHLVLNVHFFNRPVESPYPKFWVNLHRFMASITAILMLIMFFTGIFRLRKWHIGLHRVFLFLYGIVFVSGWVLFVR